MADDRPVSKLLYQDLADAHAYGLSPEERPFWCMAKLAGMDYEDFLAEGEERYDDFVVPFTLVATQPPEGQADAVPAYSDDDGVRYVDLAILYQGARNTIRIRRGVVRDIMATLQGDPGPPAEQRLLARLSNWSLEDVQTLSLYDWNAIKGARRNFTSTPLPEA